MLLKYKRRLQVLFPQELTETDLLLEEKKEIFFTNFTDTLMC